MSNFKNLKSMWETKGTEHTAPLLPPPPPKINLNTNAHLSLPKVSVQQPKLQAQENINDKKQEIVSIKSQIQSQMPRQSVMELKKNLQGKIKFGGGPNSIPIMGVPMMGGPMPRKNSYTKSVQSQPQSKAQQTKNQPNIKQQKPTSKEDHIPSFHESKQNIHLMFERNLTQVPQRKASQQIQPQKPQQNQQSYIIINNRKQKSDKLTPEERTEQIIYRIFQDSTPLVYEIPEPMSPPRKNSEQKVDTLKLRRTKKKKEKSDFDDL